MKDNQHEQLFTELTAEYEAPAFEELSDEIAETSNGGGSLDFNPHNPDVILYANENFGSGKDKALGIAGKVSDGDDNLDNDAFGSGWNNRTSSIKVIRGTWKIFRDSGYKDTVVNTLKPGDYATAKDFGLPDDSLTGILRIG